MTQQNNIESIAGAASAPPSLRGSEAIGTAWPRICATLSGGWAATLRRVSTIRSSVVRRHGRDLDPALGTPLSMAEIDLLDELTDLRFSWEQR